MITVMAGTMGCLHFDVADVELERLEPEAILEYDTIAQEADMRCKVALPTGPATIYFSLDDVEIQEGIMFVNSYYLERRLSDTLGLYVNDGVPYGEYCVYWISRRGPLILPCGSAIEPVPVSVTKQDVSSVWLEEVRHEG